MKTVIAGSRGARKESVFKAMAKIDWTPTLIISGCARGADAAGEAWAAERGIPVDRMPANWAKYGRSAGMRRNIEMVEKAEALVAVWDSLSRGTEDVIARARRLGLTVKVFGYEGEELE